MSDLVRVRVDAQEFNTSPEQAAAEKWTVLDEPTHAPDGQPRGVTRLGGRPEKPLTTASAEAAKKKAGQPSAATTED